MNIQPDAQTTDAADKPKEQGVLCSKDLLAVLCAASDREYAEAKKLPKYGEGRGQQMAIVRAMNQLIDALRQRESTANMGAEASATRDAQTPKSL